MGGRRGRTKGQGERARERDAGRGRGRTGSVVSVQDGEGEEGPVAVGGEGSLGQGREVVHVVEPGAVGLVEPGQQQVHVVRGLREEGPEHRVNPRSFAQCNGS